jgi:hypothetical protein
MLPGSSSSKTLKKAFFFNFELYTNGDVNFQKELIDILILNLQEVLQSLAEAKDQQETLIYRKACHKSNTTLLMFADPELISTIVDLKTNIHDVQLSSFLTKRSEEIILELKTLMTEIE